MNPGPARLARPWPASLFALALLFCMPALAQSLPPPVVLVLKVLSSTHVRPVTGVVLTGDGLLVVPAAFVERGDDIVVLAGGTDLQRDARPTRTLNRSAELGLAVLAADGLNRPAMPVSGDAPVPGETLRFVAFPPAEDLVSGHAPIVEESRLTRAPGASSFEAAPALPNLDGALLDSCGYLAGLVLARGEANLQRDTTPDLLLREALKDALAQLDVPVTVRACRSSAEPETRAAAAAAGPGSGPQMLDPGSLQPTGPDLGAQAQDDPTPPATAAVALEAGNVANSPSQAGPEVATGDEALRQATADSAGAAGVKARQPAAPASASAEPGFGWITLAVLIASAALGGWWAGRRGRLRPSADARPGDRDGAVGQPDGRPQLAASPVPGQSALNVSILYPDGRAETRGIQLGPDGPGYLIGRGQADLVIEDDRLARLHGRLELQDGRVLYSDLGSHWGSWIDGIACLEGERFFLSGSVEVQLGEIRIRIEPPDPAQNATAESLT